MALRSSGDTDAGTLERRARRLRALIMAVMLAVALVGLSLLSSLNRGPGTEELIAGSSAAFGQHYEALEERRIAAGVATMATPSSDVHAHPRLRIWANGRAVPVPAGIGIDPRRDAGQMAALHTHGADGTVHNEGQADATLGQFFAIWGVPFSDDRLGPHRAGAGRVLQMWVDGEPSDAWASLRLADGQEIRISLGPARQEPPG